MKIQYLKTVFLAATLSCASVMQAQVPTPTRAIEQTFTVPQPDYKLSPYTGMTRDGWIAAAKYLLDGAFTYIRTIDDPMYFPKQLEKTYPRNEGEVPTAKLEGLCRTLFLAAPLLREDPELSLNGICVADYYRHQLLNLINPEFEKRGHMLHNDSHKFESAFVGLTIPTNRSVMFGSLSGCKLGIFVAHGEGKFSLPYDEDKYNVVAKYSYDGYPGNPNGSDYSVAALASADGRHIAIMPHLERAFFPWQNAYYPAERMHSDQITPWFEAFVNARRWVESHKGVNGL